MTAPVQTMRRLLAGLEACAAEEAGLSALDDWPGLAALAERELALVRRLAEVAAGGGPDPAGELTRRVAALQARFTRVQARLAEGRARIEARLGAVRQATVRARAVGGAYRRNAI